MEINNVDTIRNRIAIILIVGSGEGDTDAFIEKMFHYKNRNQTRNQSGFYGEEDESNKTRKTTDERTLRTE